MTAPDASWARSIDAVYKFVDAPEVHAANPRLADKVTEAVRACEAALDEYGYVHWLRSVRLIRQVRALRAELQRREGLCVYGCASFANLQVR